MTRRWSWPSALTFVFSALATAAFFSLYGATKSENHSRELEPTSRRLSEIHVDDKEIDKNLQAVISASTHLISLEFSSDYFVKDDSYSGVIGVFCKLDFDKQKKEPNMVSMFRELEMASGCDNEDNVFTVDLGQAVELARDYDTKLFQESFNSGINDVTDKGPFVLNLKGAIFHESRCGSTLVANTLVALNPEKNRVYSEATPPKLVLKLCGEDFTECTVEAAANLLRDVVYIMGRSNDPLEENLFFKFQSTTTRTMQVFRTAFPSTPWIFIYREPVEVLQSQLDMNDTSKANCVKNYKKSTMIKLMAKKLRVKLKELEDEEICALHLATICGSAVVNLEDANGLGMAVNYHADIARELVDYVVPRHFYTAVNKEGYKRVLEISKFYSKAEEGENVIFESDKNEKRAKASANVKDAAVEYLDPSYKKLEKSEYNLNKICNQVNLEARVALLYCRTFGGRKN